MAYLRVIIGGWHFKWHVEMTWWNILQSTLGFFLAQSGLTQTCIALWCQWEPRYGPNIHRILIKSWLAIASLNLAAIMYAAMCRQACLPTGTPFIWLWVYSLHLLKKKLKHMKTKWLDLGHTKKTAEAGFASEHSAIWMGAKCTLLPVALCAELDWVLTGQWLCCHSRLNSPGAPENS